MEESEKELKETISNKDIESEKENIELLNDEEANNKKIDTEKKQEEKIEDIEKIKTKSNEEIVIEEKKEENIVEDSEEEKENNKNKTKSKKQIVLISITIIIFLIFVSTIFAIMNMNNTNIVRGVYVQGIDVSNLSEEEASRKIQNKIDEILKRDITLVYNDYSITITPEQIEMNFTYQEALKDAQRIGKTNNIIIDNYSILKANIFKTNISMDINYNKEILKNMITSIDLELPGAVKKVSYEVDGDKLIITKGQAGVSIKTEELEKLIIKNVNEQLKDKIEDVKIPVENSIAEEIDIEKIYKEIYKEPKDAYIEEDPFKLHVEEDGLDFNITIEEAKKIIDEDKTEYEIPLKIIKPKVKTEDLGNKIFKQTLSKYTTIYDAGNTSRATNIAIAAKTINGKIILPGETFSYNAVLGNTTKEKGYQLGGAYVGGKVVQAYGGGICQVSTTLYNAVLYANLEIVERYNHSYAVSYVPAGRDATVSYGGKDFKFKNTRNYPVKISASAKNGVVSISFLGIKEEKEYDIEIKSTVLSYTPCATVYEDTNALEEGKQKVIQKGYNGYKSKAYKIVKYNGKVISNTLLSADTYQPMNRIIQRGTKKKTTQPEQPAENNTESNANAISEDV